MTPDISLAGMTIAYGMFLLVMLGTHFNKLQLEKDMIISTLRMSIQLILIGWILTYLFDMESWIIATLIFLLMVFFGAQTILERSGVRFPRIIFCLFCSLLLGTGTVLAIYLTLVLGTTPWYDPRIFIPLAGMIIGNSMNGSTIAVERFYSEVKERRRELETRAALGANAMEASMGIFKNAYRSSLLPTLASMTGMGIVFLPGLMTGQILGGTEPLLAIKYQITIMLAILASVALSGFIIISLERRFFFNHLDLPHDQFFSNKKTP